MSPDAESTSRGLLGFRSELFFRVYSAMYELQNATLSGVAAATMWKWFEEVHPLGFQV